MTYTQFHNLMSMTSYEFVRLFFPEPDHDMVVRATISVHCALIEAIAHEIGEDEETVFQALKQRLALEERKEMLP